MYGYIRRYCVKICAKTLKLLKPFQFPVKSKMKPVLGDQIAKLNGTLCILFQLDVTCGQFLCRSLLVSYFSLHDLLTDIHFDYISLELSKDRF